MSAVIFTHTHTLRSVNNRFTSHIFFFKQNLVVYRLMILLLYFFFCLFISLSNIVLMPSIEHRHFTQSDIATYIATCCVYFFGWKSIFIRYCHIFCLNVCVVRVHAEAFILCIRQCATQFIAIPFIQYEFGSHQMPYQLTLTM